MAVSDDDDGAEGGRLGERLRSGPRRVRCGGCGQEASWLRRGRCAGCDARWVRARPVEPGSSCASCAEGRPEQLRHFELRGLWVVLCHGCCARAERVGTAARSVEGLLLALRAGARPLSPTPRRPERARIVDEPRPARDAEAADASADAYDRAH